MSEAFIVSNGIYVLFVVYTCYMNLANVLRLPNIATSSPVYVAILFLIIIPSF